MGRRTAVATMVVISFSAFCFAQGEAEWKVTLNVTNQTVREVAETMTEATGVTVLPTETAAEATVSLSLEDTELEVAVRAIAKAIEGSFLRTYIIEPTGEQSERQTIQEVLTQLQQAWRNWMLSCTNEELDGFRERALAAMGGPPTIPPPTPTGGLMFDPIETLRGPFQEERISLTLQGAPIREALKQFTLLSGYMTLLSPNVDGQVTVDLADEELAKVLDAICQPVNAKWRPLYLIGKAREITPDQMEQGLMQMLRRGAEEFWQLPPEQRQEIIRRATEALSNIPPETVAAIKSSPWTSRIMGRVMQFVFTLPPEQRREITPLLQGIGKLMGP